MSETTFLRARETTLAALELWARGDTRVRGLWLQGSLAAGGADPFSDIDAYVAMDDIDLEAVWAAREAILGQLGGALAWSDATTPGLRAVHALMPGGARLDLFFEARSAVSSFARPAVQMIFDRADITGRLQLGWRPPRPTIAMIVQTVVRMTRQGATWPLRVLGRGQWSTMAMMELDLINSQVAQLMAVAGDPGNFYKSPFSVYLALDEADRARLDALTADALAALAARDSAALKAVHLRVLDALVEEGRRACAALGVDYPIGDAAEAEIRDLVETGWPA